MFVPDTGLDVVPWFPFVPFPSIGDQISIKKKKEKTEKGKAKEKKNRKKEEEDEEDEKKSINRVGITKKRCVLSLVDSIRHDSLLRTA